MGQTFFGLHVYASDWFMMEKGSKHIRRFPKIKCRGISHRDCSLPYCCEDEQNKTESG